MDLIDCQNSYLTTKFWLGIQTDDLTNKIWWNISSLIIKLKHTRPNQYNPDWYNSWSVRHYGFNTNAHVSRSKCTFQEKSRNNKTLQSTQKTKSKVTQNQKYAFQNPRISIGWEWNKCTTVMCKNRGCKTCVITCA